MNNLNRMPVKSPVRQRLTPLVVEAQRVQEQKRQLAIDPLMLLSEAQPLLGNPSYCTLRKWIKTGSLRVWRVGGGHFRIRLSEIERFLNVNEVQP